MEISAMNRKLPFHNLDFQGWLNLALFAILIYHLTQVGLALYTNNFFNSIAFTFSPFGALDILQTTRDMPTSMTYRSSQRYRNLSTKKMSQIKFTRQSLLLCLRFLLFLYNSCHCLIQLWDSNSDDHQSNWTLSTSIYAFSSKI